MKSRRDVILATIATLAAAPGTALAQTKRAASAKRLLEAKPKHGDMTLGDPKAPVTMIEYASATCPHCAAFHLNVMPMVRRDYIFKGKIFYVFRELPIDNLAVAVFMLARCVGDDQYFAAIDELFRTQSEWMTGDQKKKLYTIIANFGLDEKAAAACVERTDLSYAIIETATVGNEQFGVTSTPTVFLNGAKVEKPGDVKVMKHAIESELARVAR